MRRIDCRAGSRSPSASEERLAGSGPLPHIPRRSRPDHRCAQARAWPGFRALSATATAAGVIHGRKAPGYCNARRYNFGRFWTKEFGDPHTVIVIASYFENVTGRDGKSRVLRFVPCPGGLMWIACLVVRHEGRYTWLVRRGHGRAATGSGGRWPQSARRSSLLEQSPRCTT